MSNFSALIILGRHGADEAAVYGVARRWWPRRMPCTDFGGAETGKRRWVWLRKKMMRGSLRHGWTHVMDRKGSPRLKVDTIDTEGIFVAGEEEMISLGGTAHVIENKGWQRMSVPLECVDPFFVEDPATGYVLAYVQGEKVLLRIKYDDFVNISLSCSYLRMPGYTAVPEGDQEDDG